MLVQMAEDSYRNGLAALESDSQREAMAYFEAAIELERRQGASPPQARYLSHYGLCLAVHRKQTREGVRFCRKAVSIERFDPELQWNLGRTLLAAGFRRKAREAFVAGLKLQPDHRGIRQDLKWMGMRKKPFLPFLARQHPLNVYFGRRRNKS